MGDKYLCIMAAMIALCYSVYIISHVIAGLPIPDGVIFGSVVAAIGYLTGRKVWKLSPEEEKTIPEGHEETHI